jgi:hypothetical protein
MSELEHTDALAAEYVLGTLDAGERAQARALLTVDPGFVAKVQFWERRLGELHTMVEPVEPEPGLWLRIKARMMEAQAAPVGLPEPQNLEFPPAAVATEVPPGDAPSLEEIEATIAQAAAALNADAAQAPPAEAAAAAAVEPPTAEAPMAEVPTTEAPAAEAPAAEAPVAEVPSLDALEVTISETTVTLSAAAQPPSPEAAPPPLDGEAAATPAEATAEPPAEAAPPWEVAPAWEAAPAAPAEPMPAAPVLTVAEVADATAPPETTAPVEASAAETPPAAMAVEPAVIPPALPPPPAPEAAPVLTAEERWTPAVEPQRAVMAVRRGLRRWRAFALLMTLVVVALAALLAAWRFAPERVPPTLRPLELMRQMGVTVPAPAPPPRRPLLPQTQFDE